MNKVICAAVLLGCLNVLVSAGPMIDDGHMDNVVHQEQTSVEDALMKKLNNKCTNRDVSSCVMLKLVTYFNRMLKKSSIEIGDIEITQTATVSTSVDAASMSRNFDTLSEEAQVTEVLADKFWNFVRSRSLKWKISDDVDLVISGNSDKDGALNLGFSLRPNANGVVDGRKKKNGLGALVAAVALKIALLKALAFKGLVLLVGKALLISKLALVLASIIGLKKLLSQEKHVTYEVVAQHPHHEHGSGGGHDSYSAGGWGRAGSTAGNNLAYRGYDPNTSSYSKA